MTIPPLPPQGSTDWYGHYAGLDAAARTDRAGRIAHYRTEPPTQILSMFQTGHGWTTTGGTGVDVNSTADYIRGTQSVKFTTTSGAGFFLQKTGMPAFDLTGKAFRIVMKLVNRDALANIILRVGSNNLADAYRFRCNPRNTTTQSIGVNNEWFTFTVGWADLYDAQGGNYTALGGIPGTTTGFTDVQLNLSQNGTTPLTGYVQSIELIPAAKGKYPNGVVSVSFDDGWDSQRLALPAMDARGLRGTQYTIAETIGGVGWLNHGDLRRMQLNGWEIAGHSYTKAAHDDRYITKTAAEIEAECRDLHRWLRTNGYEGASFAYPGGEFDVTTDGVLVGDIVRQYFDSGRSILFSTGVVGHFNSDQLPPAMPWRVRAISGIAENKPVTSADNPTFIASAGGVLDRVAYAGGWLILTFHQVVTGVSNNGLAVGVAAFEGILDGIQARGMPVLPVNEVLADYIV